MSVLRNVLVLAFLLFASSLVRAGDTATVKILGFSADGGIFAFEEYGVQDGSGFPYSNRFYIDTATDTFISGTPIRVRLDNEQVSLEEARSRSKDKAQSIVSDEELNEGFSAGWNAVTELSADPHRMMVNPRPIFPPLDDRLEFRLEELTLNQPAGCENLGKAVGFRLLRVATEPGVQTQIVHEDSEIPASRSCPLGYSIVGVQTYFPDGDEPVFAVLLAVRRVGFEGPDHRFIAVTGRL